MSLTFARAFLLIATIVVAVELGARRGKAPIGRAGSSESLAQKLRSQIASWRETEIKEIRTALSKAQGDKIIAAALLGIGKTTIYRKLTKSGS